MPVESLWAVIPLIYNGILNDRRWKAYGYLQFIPFNGILNDMRWKVYGYVIP